MFDGRIGDDGCIYYSKDKYQIEHMHILLRKIFKAKPRIQLRDNGVYGLVFYQVEFAGYIKNRKEELLTYLNNGAPKTQKREFLRAFFDDEGCVFYKGDTRRIRGYQKSGVILRQIVNLLKKFDINSKIDKSAKGIEISGKKDLERFAKEINFSPEIYINPDRKNGVWKEKISKRDILALALSSYQKN
jgi:intein-encoded DNA endonuclease-like protein